MCLRNKWVFLYVADISLLEIFMFRKQKLCFKTFSLMSVIDITLDVSDILITLWV